MISSTYPPADTAAARAKKTADNPQRETVARGGEVSRARGFLHDSVPRIAHPY